MVEVRRESGEQDQRAETGRADRVAFGDGFGGVADGVERIGGFANRIIEARHFGDAAGVVGDRTEGVERHDHAGKRQHRGDGDADADQAAHRVGEDDAGDDDQGRNRARFKRDGEALDDVGAVAGDRRLGDRLHRAIADAGVVFRDPDDQAGDDEAGNAAPEQVHGGDRGAKRVGHRDRRGHRITERDVDGAVERRNGEHGRGDEALVERAHDIARAGRETHEVGADDRGDDAHARDGERQDHHAGLGCARERDRGENHGGDDGHRVGFEQVGRHAGAVTDVVADVVRDGGGVAWIVFGNSRFDLADHVAADVGPLGEDAAAETGEDGDERCAEAESDHGVDDSAVARRQAEADREQRVVTAEAQDGETDDEHAGDGARLEGDAEALGEALGGRFSGTDVGLYRDLHPDIAGCARQDCADQEADRGLPVHEKDGDQHGDDGADDGDRAVLAVEVGVGAFLNRLGDFLHLCAAGGQRHEPLGGKNAIRHGNDACDNWQPKR